MSKTNLTYLSKTLRGSAYCFTEQELELLFSDLKKLFPKKHKVKCSIAMKSGINYTEKSFKGVVERESSLRKDKIVKFKLQISSGEHLHDNRAMVSIDIHYHPLNSYVDINIGSQDVNWIDTANNKIIERLDNMKKPWGILYSFVFLPIICMVIALSIPPLAILINKEKFFQVTIALLFFIIIFSAITIKLSSYLYPQHTFALGKEKDVEIRREGVRKNILWTLIGISITSVPVMRLVNYLTR